MKNDNCIMRASEAKSPVYIPLRDLQMKMYSGSSLDPHTSITMEFYYVVASVRSKSPCLYIWPSLRAFVEHCKTTFGDLTENSGDTLYT